MQGYNTQGVCNEHQIVVAAELTTDSPDSGHLESMVGAAERELTGAAVTERPQVVVGRCRHLGPRPDGQRRRPRHHRVGPTGCRQAQRGTAGWDGGRYAFKRRVLETDLGKQLYAKRQVTIEPVFANTKCNRRLDRFVRRGIWACPSEWRLVSATHNLLKLHSHQPA